MASLARLAMVAAALGLAEGFNPSAPAFAMRPTRVSSVTSMPLVMTMATDKVFLFPRLMRLWMLAVHAGYALDMAGTALQQGAMK
jgi:hypothetical protein